MELKGVSYRWIHGIVTAILNERDVDITEDSAFFMIGEWYFKWILLDIPELSLKVPLYWKEQIRPLLEYLHWADLLLKLLSCDPLKDLSGFALFDIRGYRSSDGYYRRNKNFTIEYLRSKPNVHCFDNGVLVATDRFLPLFPDEQIPGHKNIFEDLFYLLDAMGRGNFIPNALGIDLAKDITLHITESKLDIGNRALSRFIYTDLFRNDHNLRDKILDELQETDITRCLILTYPYHVDVSSAVINEFRGGSRIFTIELSNRFCHEDITDEQLILTNAELGVGSSSDIIDVVNSYQVVNTNCDPLLIAALIELRNGWDKVGFNIFTTPFPTKWFMCIHRGFQLTVWEDRFKKDFYEVSGQLLAEAIAVIRLIYQLDWIGNYLPRDKNAALLLPKAPMFPDVISALKDHLIHTFGYIGYSEEIGDLVQNGKPIILLDAFNIILLNNIPLSGNAERLRIVVPDFLYYTYQPFARYRALKYHFDALTRGARAIIDKDQTLHLEQWQRQGQDLLEKCRNALRDFKRTKAIKEDQGGDEQALEKPELVSDLSRSEMLEHIVMEERRSAHRNLPINIEITVSGNRKIVLRPTTPVLIRKNGYLIRTIAAVLDDSSLFVPIEDIVKNMDIRNMVDRLITLSDGARHWHQDLLKLSQTEPGLYNGMRSEGLSISRPTFEKDYLQNNDSENELHLPRSKNDWKIVCDRLAIEDRQTAWNAVKCREDINRLKAAYTRIIGLMVDTGSFGINISDSVIEQITRILAELPDTSVNEKEKKRDTIALIAEISDKIHLEQIEQIIT
ncbi:hypothetical protein [Mucilaginibacter sp.]|jgi:hypothetical protein|uniref:hypothetical protein n=1 Tax=Mucilaginibacter sp. TaxID=1882438 RepID=UPI002BEF5080|nr:hypothetical protein [Mucilaginibacter sp.]HTI58983.1 hypothetical protein [Mucilaginibacter sp.]